MIILLNKSVEIYIFAFLKLLAPDDKR